MQITLVIIIFLLCAAYASWRIYRQLSSAQDPCAGCEGCELKQKMQQKQPCEAKK